MFFGEFLNRSQKLMLVTPCSYSFIMLSNSRLLFRFSKQSLKYSSIFPTSSGIGIIRWRHSNTPLNTVIMFVPQQEAWIVERMGKFHRILQPGLNFLIPLVDSVSYVQSLKELAIEVPKQSAVTKDNVTLSIDGVLYLRVVDPYKASYGVEDPEFAITQLAQTTMRSELGKISLDIVFRERESLNINIVESINKASSDWGIACLRYEIRDIKLPPRVQEAMQMQVEAERKRRAAIIESEGVKASAINIAEGKKESRILASEAEKREKENQAKGEAAAIISVATARAEGLRLVGDGLLQKQGGNAASLAIAEQYVKAFGNLAKSGNTLILPANTSDVSHFVTQAMGIYQTLLKRDNVPVSKLTTSASEDVSEYFSDKEEEDCMSAPSDPVNSVIQTGKDPQKS